MHYLKIVQFLVLVVLALNGCTTQEARVELLKDSPLSSQSMYLNGRDFGEVFEGDQLDRKSLVDSAMASISYFEKIDPQTKFDYGQLNYSAAELAVSTRLFLELLEEHQEREAFVAALEANFLVFGSAANDDKGVLFTGYYEPIFPGQLTPSKEYNVPVYRRPDDLLSLDLGEFRESLKNRSIVYRIDKGQPVPYYTREEITTKGVLNGKGLEIAWMRDPVDLFFLQVQGSGILLAPDGSRVKIGYDIANGRPYSSIGKLLVDQGVMRLEDISMGSIRRYMADNPKQRDRILNHDASYVFMKPSADDGGPKGNINVPLTPLRSVATDASIFPKGALAYLKTEVPEFDEQWLHKGTRPVSHFVMVQDTGGAIKGTGRTDLFWGNGPLAENSAGAMRSYGKLFFLVAKKEILKARM